MSSGSKSQVVGYRYYFDIHMGLCRGPIDELVEIVVGGKRVWPLAYSTGGGYICSVNGYEAKPTGFIPKMICNNVPVTNNSEPLPMDQSGSAVIAAYHVFGGDEREGGISGTFDLMMGEQSQQVNPRFAALVDNSFVSAFRGVCTVFFSGIVAALNPYPKTWEFRTRRAIKGWDRATWYPEKAIIYQASDHPDEGLIRNTVSAMNPAHMIYECITNVEWGRGLPVQLIDDDSFRAAADQLYNEGFGLNFLWSREDQVGTFVQKVVDHISAFLYISRKTGRLKIKLTRDDYTIDSIQEFTLQTGLLTIREDDEASSTSVFNEMVVKYRDPVSGEDRQTRTQNLAAQEATGSIISKTTEYNGIATPDLAARVCQRDMRVHGTVLRRLVCTMDRRGADLEPGTVVAITEPSRRLNRVPFRVGKLIDSQENSGLTVYLVQDVFGLADVTYVEPVSPPAPPTLTPAPALATKLSEIPYMDLRRNFAESDVNNIPTSNTFVFLMAVRPSNFAVNYGTYTGVINQTNSVRSVGVWTPSATSIAAMTTATNTVVLENFVDEFGIEPGEAFMVDSEICRIDWYDTATKMLYFSRGCADTVPAAHAAGARLWFYWSGAGADDTPWAETQSVTGKALTNTPSGQLNPNLAPGSTLTLVNRKQRPYPPGAVTLDGMLYNNAGPVKMGFTVAWSPRNRITQAETIVAFDEAGPTAEAGTTYTIRVRRADNNSTIRTVSGITTLSWQYTEALWNTDGSPREIVIELESVRDGFTSYQFHRTDTIKLISLTGYGYDYGNDYGGGPPTSYPAGGVNFLHHGDGTNNGTDFSEYFAHPYTAVGGPQTRTDLAPFGTAWIHVPANAYIGFLASIVSNASEYDHTSGNKTAEARILLSADSLEATILELKGYDDSRGWRFWVGADGSLNYGRRFIGSSTNQRIASAPGAVARGVPVQVAVTRVSGTTRLFVNGMVVAGPTSVSIQAPATGTINTSTLIVGGPVGVGTMRIEEIRHNQSNALYTANYTPAVGPFPNPV